jgi:4-amino-4-deoxy-L-arabinose transferase-like glycosyltransferase
MAEICLFMASFFVLLSFKKPFMDYWDSFMYVLYIIHNEPTVLLGRLGFIYFFNIVWKFLEFFGLQQWELHHVISLFNILFSSSTVVAWFLIARRVFKNINLAFGSSIILLFSPDFVRYGSEVFTEPMAMFLAYSSLYAFTKAVDDKKPRLLWLSGLVFIYSLSVRESNIFLLLFFPAYYLIKREQHGLAVKDYGIFIFIMLVFAFLGVAYVLITVGDNYWENLHLYFSDEKDYMPRMWMLDLSYNVIGAGFGHLIVPALGLCYMLFRGERGGVLILSTLLAPIVVLTLYGWITGRYFIICFPALALFVAALFYGLAKFIYRQHADSGGKLVVFYVFVLLWAAFSLNQSMGILKEDIKTSKMLEDSGRYYLNNFGEDTVFLVGFKGSMMGDCFFPLAESKKEIIWPGKNLTQIVEAHRSRGKTVVVEPGTYSGTEKNDVDTMMKDFTFREIDRGVYELPP